ncbi:uncharacterized protein LOC111046161 [Nilaparvata lugens]|uniref:uncharacterized protein LOC111046161 n=1 Tax=Nilaparvata lugens TaxID=108931 RepID=UPI000B99BC6F|nr:uncharacterized protein LOC111046161 [Nilaparvata lugens]XP_039282663.1 uncharacterized protein LOC111046161 [Nilaparvata lugens]
MESKLKAYRRRRAREELLDRTQNKIKSIFNKMFNSDTKDDRVQENDTRLDINNRELVDQAAVSESESVIENESIVSDEDGELFDSRTWTKLTLYTSLWAFLFVLAIHAEFGAVYFVISLMVILYKNTRTGPKKAGELSAYSVFNPNCEAIEGTLDAEQLQKELLYGFR